jgi:hypothetical protein
MAKDGIPRSSPANDQRAKILSKHISQPARVASDIFRWPVSIVLPLIFGFGENLAQ